MFEIFDRILQELAIECAKQGCHGTVHVRNVKPRYMDITKARRRVWIDKGKAYASFEEVRVITPMTAYLTSPREPATAMDLTTLLGGES